MKASSQHGDCALDQQPFQQPCKISPRFRSELSQYNSIAGLVHLKTCLEDALICVDVHVFRTDWIVESQSQIPIQFQFKQFTFSVSLGFTVCSEAAQAGSRAA